MNLIDYIVIITLILIVFIMYIFFIDLFITTYYIFIDDFTTFFRMTKRELGFHVETEEDKINNNRKSVEIYNKVYNMNYFQDRNYYESDYKEMLRTEAFVLSDPIEFELIIYERKKKFYKIDILYKIENKYYDKDEELVLFYNDFNTNEPYEKLIKFPIENVKNKYIYIRTPIISYKKLERGNYITVYYENDNDGSRIAPPFLEDRYIYHVY